MPKGKTGRVSDAGVSATYAHIADWVAEFDALHARLAPRFARAEPRERVRTYITGLLQPLKRKNGWQLAVSATNSTPDGMQRLLNAAEWDADAVRDDLRKYIIDHLADPDAVLVLDETGFIKKGTKSVGVKRQYSGTAGRIENCQIGVFVTYASQHGHTLIDRELYLPQEWIDDTARRTEAGIPAERAFATKPQLAQQMLGRVFAAGVPSSWVTGDAVYGRDRTLRRWLEEQHRPFVLECATTEPLWYSLAGRAPVQTHAATIADALAPEAWQRLNAGDGAKGPRVYEWARARLNRLQKPPWDHWLLVRRSITDPTERAYYVVFAPDDTPLERLVWVAGRRWTVEESFELAKDEVGLDQYEVRKWQAWYRHITLAMVAQAFLTVIRAHEGERADEKKEVGPMLTVASAPMVLHTSG